MTTAQARTLLAALTARELSATLPAGVSDFVGQIMGAARPLGVLFYGSGLRGGIDDDTLLDFYVIVERQSDWPRTPLARLGNAVLPPNVEYHEQIVGGRRMRAKVAILSLRQFRALTGFATLDTTIWARFSQPSRLVWARDAAAARALQCCVMRALVTAARWAALLGPQTAPRRAFWDALYRRTYGAELRVESGKRPTSLVDACPDWYEQALEPCWVLAGLHPSVDGNAISPGLSASQKQRAASQWGLRARFGRPLNIMRLIKAAYTFTGAARYVAWKLRRHSGIEIPITPFAEKHPLLAAPPVFWSLWRRGAFTRR
ncbi:hypothetical protein K2X14_12800 [Acetobacter sp. TBRC 12305]|uniref:Phosphatidate cytidylyltransferase n=1 Tax=Acetobacter garciniae TaxID=2817435 RepID=A0A939HQ42_9PROT|nr:hypothetical protein [Acetobacter garciniae]MBO1325822.1 hypothetical protein [Acetobacter garciniae]MBX0345722.1 hypothetical protein [Acetobacter garciniae]